MQTRLRSRAYSGTTLGDAFNGPKYAPSSGDLPDCPLLSLGGTVPVNVRNEHNGATPLHGAAVEGQMAVIEYLLSMGADVNALNAYGDSPVQDAISMNHPDAVAVLEARGGKNIRGPDAERPGDQR
jgi:hypothetical protein